ncbi:MAG TPA: TIGR02221 family CRISPR-associated protein [Dehalococcoidia bacterium]|nr:TIGR02221 family CRISPR-associated protein [Dehalococcoidia bacterium]
MKAISFLGTSVYQTVTYVWQDAVGEYTCTTHLFPEAVAKIFQPEQLVIMATPEVQKHNNIRTLSQRLGDLVRLVPIPEGRTEAELWEIFDRCVQVVGEEEELLLDITHAFRSLPLVVFVVATFLRRTKNVNVRYIVYGGFESRRPLREPVNPSDRAPIFDLTPLLELVDWLSGIEFFLQHGDASLLGQRLEAAQQRLWRQRDKGELPRRLQSVGHKLISLSQAMQLARPRDVARHAQQLVPMLEEAASEAEAWAKPFAAILHRTRQEAAKLSLDDPDRLDQETLAKQLALMEHFLRTGLVLQSVLLAREWLVNFAALQYESGDWLAINVRDRLAKALAQIDEEQKGSSDVLQWATRLPQGDQLANLWKRITSLRNDVAHCGLRKNAPNMSTIRDYAYEVLQDLRSLLEWAPDRALQGGQVVIDLKELYGEVAKLDELRVYVSRVLEQAGEGNDVLLTGQAPVWLYLAVAHALHGKARRLFYSSPVTGEVLIFDHSSR